MALQETLQTELTEGVTKFQEDVNDFDKDFQIRGPMVPGLAAKEASDRVKKLDILFCFYENKSEYYESIFAALIIPRKV